MMRNMMGQQAMRDPRTMPAQSQFGAEGKYAGMMPGSPEHRAAMRASSGGMGGLIEQMGQGFDPRQMMQNGMNGQLFGGFDPSRFPQQALQNSQGLDAVRQRMGK